MHNLDKPVTQVWNEQTNTFSHSIGSTKNKLFLLANYYIKYLKLNDVLNKICPHLSMFTICHCSLDFWNVLFMCVDQSPDTCTCRPHRRGKLCNHAYNLFVKQAPWQMDRSLTPPGTGKGLFNLRLDMAMSSAAGMRVSPRFGKLQPPYIHFTFPDWFIRVVSCMLWYSFPKFKIEKMSAG